MSNRKHIRVRTCRTFPSMEVPHYHSDGASGVDVSAAITDPIAIPAGKWRLIPTGLFMAIPEGYEAQIRPRSGLALKHGITILNTPGTVDSDYRGSIGLIVMNMGDEPFTVEPGMRLAQLVFTEVVQAHFEEVGFTDDLSQTARGEAGFGSTGA